MKKILLLLGAFCCLSLIRSAMTSPAEENTVLPGHLEGQATLLQKSSDIAVVTLSTKGFIDAGPPGMLEYREAMLNVEAALKGNVSATIKGKYYRDVTREPYAEVEPSLGVRYIVFMQHRALDRYNILRFFVYTDDRLLEIKKLIASAEVAH